MKYYEERDIEETILPADPREREVIVERCFEDYLVFAAIDDDKGTIVLTPKKGTCCEPGMRLLMARHGRRCGGRVTLNSLKKSIDKRKVV